MQNGKQSGKTGNWADALEKSGQITISGNKITMGNDGKVSLSRHWSAEELAAFDRIEKIYQQNLEALDRMQSSQA